MDELDKKDKKITLIILLSVAGLVIVTLLVFLIMALSKPKYEITVNTDGHKLKKDIVMKDNTIKELPEIELKEGEVFSTWVNQDNQAIRPGIVIDKPITITPIVPVPTPETPLITLKFESGTDEKIPDIKRLKGEQIILPIPPTHKEWTFLYWVDKNGYIVSKDKIVTEDATFYARWLKPSKPKYTISFDTGTDEKIDDIKVNEGDHAILPTPSTSKENSVFKGWLDENNELVTGYYKVTKNVTFKANWQPAYTCSEGCIPNEDGKTCTKIITSEAESRLSCPGNYSPIEGQCLDLSRRYYSDHLEHDPWWTCSNPSDAMYDEVEYGGAIKWCVPKTEGTMVLDCPEDLHLDGNVCKKSVVEDCTPN